MKVKWQAPLMEQRAFPKSQIWPFGWGLENPTLGHHSQRTSTDKGPALQYKRILIFLVYFRAEVCF